MGMGNGRKEWGQGDKVRVRWTAICSTATTTHGYSCLLSAIQGMCPIITIA